MLGESTRTMVANQFPHFHIYKTKIVLLKEVAMHRVVILLFYSGSFVEGLMLTLSFNIIWNQMHAFRQQLDHHAPLYQSRLAYNCIMDIPAMSVLYHGGSTEDGYDTYLTST